MTTYLPPNGRHRRPAGQSDGSDDLSATFAAAGGAAAVAELVDEYGVFMSHREIQALRRDSRRWAYAISQGCLVAAVLSFVGIAALSESQRVWQVRGFFLAFILILLGWGIHYGFIVLDEFIRRRYGTALFMSAVIAGFGWVIQSCIRGMIVYG